MGSEVRLGAACPAAEIATYLVSAHADAERHLGSLGPTCRLVLDVRGRECATGRQVFRSGMDRVKASATDTRGEEWAMRKMAQKLDPKQIALELRSVLKSELPEGDSR